MFQKKFRISYFPSFGRSLGMQFTTITLYSPNDTVAHLRIAICVFTNTFLCPVVFVQPFLVVAQAMLIENEGTYSTLESSILLCLLPAETLSVYYEMYMFSLEASAATTTTKMVNYDA